VRSELRETERYVHDALGVAVKAKPWSDAGRLPHFLKERYRFAQAELLGLRALFVIDVSPEEQAPATVRKHMETLRSKQHAEPIYIREQVTAYNRKRLIEQKVPFIVPGNQMYLPMLAIDLREHFRRLREETSTFSPSTQVVVLYALLHDPGRVLTPSETAPLRGYSRMTMTRVFDELETAGLAEVTVRGRERFLRFSGSRRDIWEKPQPYVRSPVTKRVFICGDESAKFSICAGLTALAHFSMLAPPAHTTYALSREEWKALRDRHKIIEVPAQDPDATEVEVWRYAPALLAEHGMVDRLSLYFSLKAGQDERIEAALEEMLGKFKW
jgi:hypothetical protein